MESDEDIEETPEYGGVPATIILINVFDPLNLKTFEVAYLAVCRLLRQYLRESSSQNVAVCLFGIEVSNASMLGAKSVLDVFPLSQPTLDEYKKLQNVNFSSLIQEKDLSMSEVLLHCSKIFASCKKQLSSRQILILSRFDTPPIQADQKPTLKRVVDLTDSNVELKLINVSQHDYEIHSFYHDFLANIKKDVVLPNPVWDVKEIERTMYKQSHRHLAVAKLSFDIGQDFNIGVGVYSLLKSNTCQISSFLDRETNAILSSVTKTVKVSTDDAAMDVDNDEQKPKQVPLLKSEVIHYQEYGGERIEFTDTEMRVLKNPFGPPMLKLLGFKPASLVCKEKWFLKRGYFLFPNESIIEGSTVAFRAMYQACVETGMVAFCALCTRVNSKPLNVVLSPCTNPLGLEIDVGFDVICLPFVENVRDIQQEDDEDTKVALEHKTVMKDIIQTIYFDYKPDMFENPTLQSKYRALEAIALDEVDMEPFVDTTKPNSEKFADIKDDLFQEIFGSFAAVPVKRAATSRNDSISSKTAKTDEIDESLLQSRLATNKVAQYTVADLKQILKSKHIPGLPALTGLKKNDLVNLVVTHLK